MDIYVPKTITDISDDKKRIYKFLEEIENGFFEVHTTPQVYFIKDENGIDFKVDKILCFETLNKDFNKMAKELEIEIKLSHQNPGQRDKQNAIRKIIENDIVLKEKINKIYKDDIVIYNSVNL